MRRNRPLCEAHRCPCYLEASTLCTYLQKLGVAVLLMSEVEAITSEFRAIEVGMSYLADTLSSCGTSRCRASYAGRSAC
jgi:hypothetical protein